MKKHIPNALSLLRVFLLVPFVVALSQDRVLPLLLTSIIIILSDYFDGFLARTWNVISESGKILDPLADKICSAVAAIAMVYLKGFPLWLLLIIVGRDILILMAGLFLMEFRHFTPVSSGIGRATMVIMSICMLAHLFDFTILEVPTAIFTAAALVVSSVSYALYFLRVSRRSGIKTCRK